MWVICSTAAATFRQAVALVFDHMVCAESLPLGKFGSGGYISRTSSVTGDINRNINRSEYVSCCNHFAIIHILCISDCLSSQHFAISHMWCGVSFFVFLCLFNQYFGIFRCQWWWVCILYVDLLICLFSKWNFNI